MSNCYGDLANQHLLFMLQMNFPFKIPHKHCTFYIIYRVVDDGNKYPALPFFSAHLKKTMPLEIGAILETQGLDWHINGSSSIHFQNASARVRCFLAKNVYLVCSLYRR